MEGNETCMSTPGALHFELRAGFWRVNVTRLSSAPSTFSK